MRSALRSAILAGSVLSLSFALVGCEDAKTTTPPAAGGNVTTEPVKKDAMEPEKKDAMEPAPKVDAPAPAPVEPPK